MCHLRICSAAIVLPALPAPRCPPPGVPKRPQNAVNAYQVLAIATTATATLSERLGRENALLFIEARAAARERRGTYHGLAIAGAASHPPRALVRWRLILPKSKLG